MSPSLSLSLSLPLSCFFLLCVCKARVLPQVNSEAGRGGGGVAVGFFLGFESRENIFARQSPQQKPSSHKKKTLEASPEVLRTIVRSCLRRAHIAYTHNPARHSLAGAAPREQRENGAGLSGGGAGTERRPPSGQTLGDRHDGQGGAPVSIFSSIAPCKHKHTHSWATQLCAHKHTHSPLDIEAHAERTCGRHLNNDTCLCDRWW